MKRLATAIATIALVGTPAFAADMAVKAPPPAPAPAPTWTGFYGGIQFGGGWSDEVVNYSPNDPISAVLISGNFGGPPGIQPMPNDYRVSQSGAVGGFEAGYNWQAGSNWLVGLETDFSFSSIDGRASGTSFLQQVAPAQTQTTTAEQSTDWYGTVRGRAGWLVTPNLLLFGTGGFAYGRVSGSANYMFGPGPGSLLVTTPGFSLLCLPNVTCFAGSSSEIRTGWTAGGGAEWLLDQHWSAKIEYQFVDLGTFDPTVPGRYHPLVCAAILSVGSKSRTVFASSFRDRPEPATRQPKTGHPSENRELCRSEREIPE
jgi:outer membrane immunogenic protein